MTDLQEHCVSDDIHKAWAMVEEPTPRSVGRISPSKIVNGCLLTIYYDMIGSDFIPPNRDAKDTMTLSVGKFLHEQTQNLLKSHYESKGIIYIPEIPVKIYKSCEGTTDALLIIGDTEILHEYKTIGDSGFNSLGKYPIEHNEHQLQLYMYGRQVNFAKLSYISRNTFSIREFTIVPKKDVVEKYIELIDKVEECVIKKTPPAPKEHYLGKSPCTKVCFYRHKCPAALNSGRRKI